MQINSIHLYNESMAMGKLVDAENQNIKFEEVMKEVMESKAERNASVEELVKNIESNHHAKISSFSDNCSTDQIAGLNNVIIGGDTLEKMKNNSVFREKIMKVIDECCSYSAQKEISSLSPPAKSAGVIIYPNGSYLCWIESIYSDSEHIERDLKNNEFTNKDIKNKKESRIEDIVVEQFNNFRIVPDLGVIDKKRSK